jgi:hypothetical protein
MSEETERRRIFLLVPHSDGVSVLVDDAGGLPSFVVALEPGETTIGAAWRTFGELGWRGTVLDCFIDQTPRPDGAAAVVPAIVELAALDGRPADARWAPIAGVSPVVESAVGPGLVDYITDRLAELRGLRPVPDQRTAWCRPGWYERVGAWVGDVLEARGENPAVTLTPFRQWGVSAVLRVEAEASRYWFKAVFPPFAAEPGLTAFLAHMLPGRVPHVIAVEPEERWMLLGEMTGTTASVDRAVTDAAIGALVDLQRGFIGRTDELLASGCADRPLRRLPDDVLRALDLPTVQAALHVDTVRSVGLARWLADAVATVEALGIPHTLVHGDFHPGNVMCTDDGVVLFDWSDAAVAHPLVDAAVWVSWSRDDPTAVDEIWRAFAAAWSDVADPAAVVASRRALDAITGAYHFVSYAQILVGLEPLRRPEALDGLTGFFDLFDQTLPEEPPVRFGA